MLRPSSFLLLGLFTSLFYRVISRVVREALGVASCYSRVATTTGVCYGLTCVRVSIKARKGFRELDFRFVSGRNGFRSHYGAGLASSAVRVLTVRAVRLRISFFGVSSGAFSVRGRSALYGGAPRCLVLRVDFLVREFIGSLARVRSYLRRFPNGARNLQ